MTSPTLECFHPIPEILVYLETFSIKLRKMRSHQLRSIIQTYLSATGRISCQLLNRPLENSCDVSICGPSRIGKDEAFLHLYFKKAQKIVEWFINQDYVLTAGVDISQCVWFASSFKICTEMCPFSAEIKGSTLLIRPKCITVTPKFRMHEWFTGIECFACTLRTFILRVSWIC